MRHAARTATLCLLAFGATALATVPPATLLSAAVSAPGLGVDIRDRFNQTFPGGSLIEVRGQLRRVFGQRFSTGATPHDSVESFLMDWSSLWGVPFEQLQPVGPFDDGAHQIELMYEADGTNPSFTAVYWQQHVRGVPVFRGWVWGLAANEDSFPMVLGGGTLKDLGEDFPASLEGRDLSPSTMDPAIYTREAMNQFGAPPQMTSPRYVVWAGVDTDPEPARLAIEFVATGGGPWDPANHQKMQYVVDADTGEILHQESQILHGAVSGTVNGKVTDGSKADACNTEVTKGLPYVGVVVGGTTSYADANGNFNITYTGTSNVSVAPTINGRYFRVNESGGNSVTSVSAQTVANGGLGHLHLQQHARGPADRPGELLLRVEQGARHGGGGPPDLSHDREPDLVPDLHQHRRHLQRVLRRREHQLLRRGRQLQQHRLQLGRAPRIRPPCGEPRRQRTGRLRRRHG